MAHVPLWRVVDWIAMNDEASIDRFEEVRYSLTVAMAADLLGTNQDKIARLVLERRKELGYITEVR